MPTIAPWLQLPNFQAAAEAGARIGLQQKSAADDLALNRERLAQSATEAAGRLGLGFSELGVSANRAKAEQDLARATMALHAGRYSDLNSQAMDKLGLSRERLDSLEGNRDVVNGLNQDKLDSLNNHRSEIESLRSGGVPHGTTGAAPAKDKVFMVKVPIPANSETGEAATFVNLPSNHPAAQAYLNAHGLGDRVPESVSGLYTPSSLTQGGETLPLDTGTAPPPQSAASLPPRNQIYMGGGSEPIFDPSPLPPEELASPEPAEPLAQKPSKRFKYDPATGKFEPQS